MDQRSMDNLIESYLDAMRFEKHLDSIKYNRNMYQNNDNSRYVRKVMIEDS